MKFTLGTAALSLLSLAVITCNAQGTQISIPSPGSVVYAGQNLTLQIVRPLSHQGSIEVGMAIGLVSCTPDFPCTDPRMGHVLFNGKYTPVLHEIPGKPYQNFSVYIPTVDEGVTLGPSLIQVARLHLFGAGPTPTYDLYNISVTVANPTTTPPSSVKNIHPLNADTSKCVGIVGGIYANGSAVDVYDCNNSNTQKWQWIGQSLVSIDPSTQVHWCLDAGNIDQLANGVKMKIWKCFDGLPQQSWSVADAPGALPIALSVGGFCLDLTDSITTNGNVLQIWSCSGGRANQQWTFTAVQ